jgi:hypothetical protein
MAALLQLQVPTHAFFQKTAIKTLSAALSSRANVQTIPIAIL